MKALSQLAKDAENTPRRFQYKADKMGSTAPPRVKKEAAELMKSARRAVYHSEKELKARLVNFWEEVGAWKAK